MKHFKDGNAPELEYGRPIGCGLSNEDREYFDWLQDGNSLLHHDDDNQYECDDSGGIKHFQD